MFNAMCLIEYISCLKYFICIKIRKLYVLYIIIFKYTVWLLLQNLFFLQLYTLKIVTSEGVSAREPSMSLHEMNYIVYRKCCFLFIAYFNIALCYMQDASMLTLF